MSYSLWGIEKPNCSMLHWDVTLYKYERALTKRTENALQLIFRLSFYWSGSTEGQSFQMCNTGMLISVFFCLSVKCHLKITWTSNYIYSISVLQILRILRFTFFLLHFIWSLLVREAISQTFLLDTFNLKFWHYVRDIKLLFLQRYPLKQAW